ncbi:MAG: MraY family glycosyltransferase [Candidatus Nitrospinota bacterium M3_3B_026]
MTLLAISAIAAFGLSLLLTEALRRYALRRSMVDTPNHRTSHAAPTPRGGGMSFVIVWLALCAAAWGAGYVTGDFAAAVLPGAILVAGAGFMDDHGGLSASVRLFIQLAGAALLIYAIGGWPGLDAGAFTLHWGAAGAVAAALAIVWSVNLFNFMDGIDSIASMEAISVLAPGGIMLILSGGAAEGALALLLAICVAGFLVLNLPPARIFMGDGGSYFLGFMIAAFAIIGEVKSGVPALLWATLYAAFWIDATLTLIRRLARKDAWSKPHRLHAYQRLHQSGLSHGKVTLATLALNVTLIALTALAYLNPSLTPFSFILAIAITGMAYAAVEKIRPIPPEF